MSGVAATFLGKAATLADGTNLFTSSASGAFSYTVVGNAPGFVDIYLWGAGASGSYMSRFFGSSGSGGGGGGYVKHHMAVQPGVTVIAGSIGPGGVGSITTYGYPGGATTVTTPALTASGGGGGSQGVAGVGGTATGGNVTNTTGHPGGRVNLADGGGAAPDFVDQTTAGGAGSAPGGGGAGQVNGYGGVGANGKVVINARTS